VAGVFTNLLTTHWSWWVFSALVVLATALAAAAVLSTRPVDLPTEDRSPVQAGPRPVNMLMPPAGTRIFCGRSDERAQLADTAGKHGRDPDVLVISGIAGVGKTELAVRVAEDLASGYPDGVFWIGLRTYAVAPESRLGIAQALQMLLSAAGEQLDRPAADEAELSRAWRTASAGQRILLVLDDADNAPQVGSLLPGGAGPAVLITSRHMLAGIDPDCHICLQPFGKADAEQLAEAILGRAGLADQTAVKAIADRYRLPLALRHICNLRIGNPGVGIADLLADSTAGLDEASAALAMSLGVLNRSTRRLLHRISRYPGSRITAGIAATLADRSLEKANKLLAELYQHGLLSPDGDRGYRVHDLVRDAAFREAISWRSRREVAATDDRIFRYVIAAIESALEVLYPGPFYGREKPPSISPPRHSDYESALEWLDLHYADLLAVSRRAIAVSYPRAWVVIFSLEYYRRMRGFYLDSISLEKHALRIAEIQKDRLGQASMHLSLGMASFRIGDYSVASENLETALRIFASLGDNGGQAMAHNELAKLARVQRELPSARQHADHALALFTRLGHATDLSAAHRQVGILDLLAGSYDSARDHLETATRLCESVGQRRGVASCHRELGVLDHKLRRYDDARSHFEAALSLYQSVNDKPYEGETHQKIAALDIDAGDLPAARRHLEIATEIYGRINNIRGRADVLATWGDLAKAAGDDAGAREFWSDAISTYMQLSLRADADEVRDRQRAHLDELGKASSSLSPAMDRPAGWVA
jgi:tetratricopeptide (TPR) repeat protein